MKKILRLQSALLKEIDKYEKLVPERSHFIDWERVHITSCAKIGYMLAEERGVDPILASAAVFSGAAFGSNTCLYGDGVIMCAQGCEIKSIDLMFATLPYACISGGITFILYLICGFVM